MSNTFELAPGWPHEHFKESPEEVHISPRSAYFMRDGKLTVRRLEEINDEIIEDAWEQLEDEDIENPLKQ